MSGLSIANKSHKIYITNKKNMGLFENIFQREAVKGGRGVVSSTSEAPTPQGANFNARVMSANKPETALTVSAYYRAVDIISSSIAVMPIELLTRKKFNAPFLLADNPKGRNLWFLLNVKPNRKMNAYQLKKQAVVNVMNNGNAYIYPRRDASGEIVEFILISANAIVNDRPWEGLVTITDSLNGLILTDVPYSDIIILRNSYLDSLGKGLSVISYAEQTLSTARTYGNESLNRVATGGRLKGIVKNAGVNDRGVALYGEKQLKNIKNSLQEQCDAGYDILTLTGDAEFMPNTMSSADLQFIESQRLTVQDIARFTGCPLALLMDSSNANYKTLSDSTNDFLTRTLLPRIADFECEFTSVLVLPAYATLQKVAFNVSKLFSLDISAMATWNKSRLECGIVCPNELRLENNLPPIEGGDLHYVSTNLAVVGSDKLMGNSRPAPEGNVEPNTDEQ